MENYRKAIKIWTDLNCKTRVNACILHLAKVKDDTSKNISNFKKQLNKAKKKLKLQTLAIMKTHCEMYQTEKGKKEKETDKITLDLLKECEKIDLIKEVLSIFSSKGIMINPFMKFEFYEKIKLINSTCSVYFYVAYNHENKKKILIEIDMLRITSKKVDILPRIEKLNDVNKKDPVGFFNTYYSSIDDSEKKTIMLEYEFKTTRQVFEMIKVLDEPQKVYSNNILKVDIYYKSEKQDTKIKEMLNKFLF